MNLYEAKRVLKEHGYKLIKEYSDAQYAVDRNAGYYKSKYGTTNVDVISDMERGEIIYEERSKMEKYSKILLNHDTSSSLDYQNALYYFIEKGIKFSNYREMYKKFNDEIDKKDWYPSIHPKQFREEHLEECLLKGIYTGCKKYDRYWDENDTKKVVEAIMSEGLENLGIIERTINAVMKRM